MKNLPLTICLLGLMLCSFLGAQNLDLDTTNTYAVVVGISDYEDELIPDLKYAHRDAEAFANFLRSPVGGALDEDHLKVLINEEATQGNLGAELDWLWDIAKENDRVIIYFSGHGDVERKSIIQPGYLLCYDAPSRNYMSGGAFPLPMFQDVIWTLSLKNKAKVVVVTDACRSGKLAGSQINGNQLTNDHLKKRFANEVKILSCQSNEYSIEGEQWGGGRGVFSYHLLDGMYGMANLDDDHSVNLMEIRRYLEDKVSVEVAPQSQIPITVGNSKEKLTTVFPEILMELRDGRKGQMQLFSTTESKSMEQDVLEQADTNIVEMYLAFKQSLKDKQFFEPQNACADFYYEKLSQEPILERLHSNMRRNYAAALQDDAQQTIKTIIDSDSTELVHYSRANDKYRLYPISLERAMELLGEEHYMYNTLMARLRYFEGLNLRLYFNIYKDDSLRIAALEKQNQSLALQDSAAHVYYEMVHLQKSWVEAEPYFKKAIDLAPAWVTPNIRLFYVYRRSSRLSKAYEIIKNLLDRNPICSDGELGNLYNLYGKVSQDLGKYEEAEAALLKAMELNPKNGEPAHALSILYDNLGRYEESEALWDKYFTKNPNSQWNVTRAGRSKYNMGKLDEAIQLYKKSLEAYQGNFHLRGELSMLLNEAGYKEEALEVAETNFQMTFSNPTSFVAPAGIFSEVELYDEAVDLVKLNREKLPKYPGPNFLIIDYLLLQGNIEAARREAQKAVELLPGIPIIKLAEGFAAYKNKEFERFDSISSELIESAPNDASWPIYIGIWHKNHGNFDLAEKYLKQALELNKLDAYSWLVLAELYYSFGKCPEVLASLNEGLSALPNHRLLKQEQAIMTCLCDSSEKARPLFLEEERLQPGFLKIWEFLEAIRLENYDVAVKTWRETRTLFRTDHLLPLYMGALIKTGDLEAAVEVLKLTNFKILNYQLLQTASFPDALRQHPEYKIYLQRNYPELFEAPLPDSLLQGVKEHPYQAYYHRFMGYFLHQEKRYHEAEESFLKSLEIEPENSYARLFLADIYLNLNRNEEASKILPDSLHLEKVMALFYAGKVYYQLNKKPLSEKYFMQFAETASSSGGWFRSANFYNNHGEMDLAEAFYKKAIEVRPERLWYRSYLTIHYFLSGKRDQAFQTVDESVKLNPGHLSFLALRAFIHYINTPEEAEPYFREVNALQPGFISIWETMELMRKKQFIQAEEAWEEAEKQFGDWWMLYPKYAYLKMKIQQKEYDTAITVLEELLKSNRLTYYYLLISDKSLDPIRVDERFKALKTHYLPEKE